ncbi:MAG: helix-turn-helix transcriptional regulator [Planctomycetota bacterium]|jgi:predicted ArsR family transcriptional regulator
MVRPSPELSEAKRQILTWLKRLGPSTARAVATRLGTTDVAARQHLATLADAGLVASEASAPAPTEGRGRGRPSMRWSLTEQAHALFPDHHAELTVGLIDAIRETVGEKGLRRIAEVRARDQVTLYRDIVPPPGTSLRRRVEALARQRTAEGYMAEVVTERRGEYVLIEHHCPICDAAKTCSGLCQSELEVFRRTLGADVEVERTRHLLSGDDRCAYRIRKKRTP